MGLKAQTLWPWSLMEVVDGGAAYQVVFARLTKIGGTVLMHLFTACML